MYVRSDVLTRQDILCALARARGEGYDIMLDDEGVREFKPRKFARGFQFYCEALAGKRARNGRPGKAATWEAYGVFMAELYKRDPYSVVAFYKNAAHFIDWTARAAASESGYIAPWLDDDELYESAASVQDMNAALLKRLGRLDVARY